MKVVMVLSHLIYTTYILAIIVIQPANAKKDIKCGACLALVEELNYEIGRVDPKKTIQVGSFRVDSNGNQDLREKPYARSETHLTELLETVCNKMDNNYGESTTANGDITFLRMQSFDGSPVSLSNVNINGESMKALKFACESIVEEYEDEFVQVFSRDRKDTEKIMCVEIGGYCSERAVIDRLIAQGSAIMKGMEEQKGKREAENQESKEENEEENHLGDDVDKKGSNREESKEEL